MNRWTWTVVMVGALAVAACGSKGEATGGAGAGEGAAPTGGAAPAADAGLTKAQAQKVVDGITFEGWERGLAKADESSFMLTFKGPKNDRDANINLMIGGMNCFASMCAELTVDAWKANEQNLKSKLSKVLIDSPDTVFSIEALELDGKKAIGVYTAGYVETKDAEGGTSRASSHMYDLYWHDGAKFISVSASGSSFPQSREELTTKVTQDELKSAAENTLKAVLAKLQ